MSGNTATRCPRVEKPHTLSALFPHKPHRSKSKASNADSRSPLKRHEERKEEEEEERRA